MLTTLWQLYADLKAYRSAPTPNQAEGLRTRFDALVGRTTCWPELNAALARMADKKADLLRVLDRPDLPLHTNTPERDFRDWATKRKISAGTRGTLGKRCRDTFLSLKSTCKKLGVRFMSYLRDRITKAGQDTFFTGTGPQESGQSRADIDFGSSLQERPSIRFGWAPVRP